MQKFVGSVRHTMFFIIGSLCLSLLLIACGGTAATPAPAPTTAPPTTAPPTPTPVPPTPTPAAAAMQTYTGTGYTIGYPQDWKATPSQSQITFSDATEKDALLVVTVPGTSTASNVDALEQLIQRTLQVTNPQDAKLDTNSVSVAGETWTQKAFTGSVNGNQDTFVLAVTSHAGNTFLIVDGAPVNDYAQVNAKDFQPMVATFKFTS